MNISQLSEQLKDVPQGTLVGYAKNPNSVVPQFLALAEIQRRQHLQAQAPAPSNTVADDVLAQANPQPAPQQIDPRLLQAQAMQQQLPENQPGVAQLPSGMAQGMAGGGIVAFAGGGLSLDDDEEDDREMAQLFPQQSSSRFDQLLEALPVGIAGGIRGLADKGTQAYQAVKAAVPASYEQAKAAAVSGKEAVEGDIQGFLSKIQHLESRGKHFDDKGRILTSGKGAEGIMQVMPKTQINPGYGVTPARDKSPEELKRVGDEYGIAMLREFKDPRLAAMAYNWGPGNVKKWLASDRKMAVPAETQKYASNFADGGSVEHFEEGGTPKERQASALAALAANMPSDYADYQSDVPMSQSDYYRQRQLAESAIRENIPVPREVKPEETRVREAAYGKTPIYGNRSSVKADASALEMTPNERNRYATIAENNRNVPPTAIAPYAPSTENYDIGFGPNKYSPDTKAPAEATPAAPSKADMYAEMLGKNLEKQMAEAEQNKKMQLGLSLLGAAGAGLKSGSRYLGQGLGDTLTGGVSTYGALKKQEQDQAKDIMAAQLGMYKFGSAAEAAAANRALEKEYKDLTLAQRERLAEADRSLRMNELSQKQITMARDDFKQYRDSKFKDLKDMYPVPMPKDPGYQAALQAIYNDPIYKQLSLISGYSQPTPQSAPAGNRPPIGTFNK